MTTPTNTPDTPKPETALDRFDFGVNRTHDTVWPAFAFATGVGITGAQLWLAGALTLSGNPLAGAVTLAFTAAQAYLTRSHYHNMRDVWNNSAARQKVPFKGVMKRDFGAVGRVYATMGVFLACAAATIPLTNKQETQAGQTAPTTSQKPAPANKLTGPGI